jgi:hypothetical protein
MHKLINFPFKQLGCKIFVTLWQKARAASISRGFQPIDLHLLQNTQRTIFYSLISLVDNPKAIHLKSQCKLFSHENLFCDFCFSCVHFE